FERLKTEPAEPEIGRDSRYPDRASRAEHRRTYTKSANGRRSHFGRPSQSNALHLHGLRQSIAVAAAGRFGGRIRNRAAKSRVKATLRRTTVRSEPIHGIVELNSHS